MTVSGISIRVCLIHNYLLYAQQQFTSPLFTGNLKRTFTWDIWQISIRLEMPWRASYILWYLCRHQRFSCL